VKRLALVTAAVAFVALGFVSTPQLAVAATTHPVGIVNFAYKNGVCPNPGGNSAITIIAGDKIAWKNCSDTTNHTVTSDDGSPEVFDKELSPGQIFTKLFDAAGPSIGYHCKIHPSMHGTILVQAAPTSTTKPAPTTTATTVKPTTTSPSTSTSTTSTTLDLNGLFDGSSTTSSSSTTSTTELAIKSDGNDGGSSGLVIALLVLAIGAVGFGAYTVWRRMQQADLAP
jgi:plastocyanin